MLDIYADHVESKLNYTLSPQTLHTALTSVDGYHKFSPENMELFVAAEKTNLIVSKFKNKEKVSEECIHWDFTGFDVFRTNNESNNANSYAVGVLDKTLCWYRYQKEEGKSWAASSRSIDVATSIGYTTPIPNAKSSTLGNIMALSFKIDPTQKDTKRQTLSARLFLADTWGRIQLSTLKLTLDSKQTSNLKKFDWTIDTKSATEVIEASISAVDFGSKLSYKTSSKRQGKNASFIITDNDGRFVEIKNFDGSRKDSAEKAIASLQNDYKYSSIGAISTFYKDLCFAQPFSPSDSSRKAINCISYNSNRLNDKSAKTDTGVFALPSALTEANGNKYLVHALCLHSSGNTSFVHLVYSDSSFDNAYKYYYCYLDHSKQSEIATAIGAFPKDSGPCKSVDIASPPIDFALVNLRRDDQKDMYPLCSPRVIAFHGSTYESVDIDKNFGNSTMANQGFLYTYLGPESKQSRIKFQYSAVLIQNDIAYFFAYSNTLLIFNIKHESHQCQVIHFENMREATQSELIYNFNSKSHAPSIFGHYFGYSMCRADNCEINPKIDYIEPVSNLKGPDMLKVSNSTVFPISKTSSPSSSAVTLIGVIGGLMIVILFCLAYYCFCRADESIAQPFGESNTNPSKSNQKTKKLLSPGSPASDQAKNANDTAMKSPASGIVPGKSVRSALDAKRSSSKQLHKSQVPGQGPSPTSSSKPSSRTSPSASHATPLTTPTGTPSTAPTSPGSRAASSATRSTSQTPSKGSPMTKSIKSSSPATAIKSRSPMNNDKKSKHSLSPQVSAAKKSKHSLNSPLANKSTKTFKSVSPKLSKRSSKKNSKSPKRSRSKSPAVKK